jgi:alpha-tubulin suppressor-like RCC1 family protein
MKNLPPDKLIELVELIDIKDWKITTSNILSSKYSLKTRSNIIITAIGQVIFCGSLNLDRNLGNLPSEYHKSLLAAVRTYIQQAQDAVIDDEIANFILELTEKRGK